MPSYYNKKVQHLLSKCNDFLNFLDGQPILNTNLITNKYEEEFNEYLTSYNPFSRTNKILKTILTKLKANTSNYNTITDCFKFEPKNKSSSTIDHVNISTIFNKIIPNVIRSTLNRKTIFINDSTNIITMRDGFCKNSNIINIILPNTVIIIDDFAFADCTNLKIINLPNSITQIRTYAFYNCKNLEHITLPKHLKTISKCLFCNCEKLKEITIPSEVTHIEDLAFYNCKNLKKVNVLNSNITITAGKNIFKNCPKVMEIICDNKDTIDNLMSGNI